MPRTPRADFARVRVRCAPAARRCEGFTLVELMLVVTIVGVLGAAVTPSVVRARGASIEASTIGSLRALHSAQVSYAASCGAGFYAPTVAALRSGLGRNAFIGPEFTADVTDRQGYRIRFTAGARDPRAPRSCNGIAAGRGLQNFFISADRLTATTGLTRYFGVNANGTIYQSRVRVRAFYAGVPPAPAMSLR